VQIAQHVRSLQSWFGRWPTENL